jgi:hypothetical protein
VKAAAGNWGKTQCIAIKKAKYGYFTNIKGLDPTKKRHSRESGNPSRCVCNAPKATEIQTATSSALYVRYRSRWIPAFAGMTVGIT